MIRKLSPFSGYDRTYEKDEGIKVKVLVPILPDEVGFSKCIIDLQSYHDRLDETSHYLLFTSACDYSDEYFMDAIPVKYDRNDIILYEPEGDDISGNLVMDLTGIFYSLNSVLDMEML